jgi:lipopolysaccharide/colanic/teichoic acid biosynthesis glycosyltransferase
VRVAVRRPEQHDRHCRFLNVAVALLGLVLVLPVLLMIAVAVKSTSPGRVLYSQRRVGLDRRVSPARTTHTCRRREDRGGRIFTIFKFRTMIVHDTTGEVWARADDPRITELGAILRKYRLDELPQLANVLLGDMNIVGPRPEQPAIFQRLKGEIVDYGSRQRILPGITGWAQINLSYDQSLDDVKRKVAFDLEYMYRRSAVEDLRIMVWTVPVMIGAKGAV